MFYHKWYPTRELHVRRLAPVKLGVRNNSNSSFKLLNAENITHIVRIFSLQLDVVLGSAVGLIKKVFDWSLYQVTMCLTYQRHLKVYNCTVLKT